MKNFVLSFCLLMSATTANARAAEHCEKCPELQKLESFFLNLNYFQEKRKDRAFVELEKVFGYAARATPGFKGRNPNLQEFAAFVKLVAAAGLYDVESALADTLTDLITHSQTLKKVYEKTLPQIETCRRENLQDSVKQFSCGEKSCVGQPPYNVEECLARKPSSSSAKKK